MFIIRDLQRFNFFETLYFGISTRSSGYFFCIYLYFYFLLFLSYFIIISCFTKCNFTIFLTSLFQRFTFTVSVEYKLKQIQTSIYIILK